MPVARGGSRHKGWCPQQSGQRYQQSGQRYTCDRIRESEPTDGFRVHGAGAIAQGILTQIKFAEIRQTR